MYVVFVIFPTLQAFRVSLYEWSGIGEPTNFVGLQFSFLRVTFGICSPKPNYPGATRCSQTIKL